jgi:hypothetical protein
MYLDYFNFEYIWSGKVLRKAYSSAFEPYPIACTIDIELAVAATRQRAAQTFSPRP